jgi:hypothetical protein
VVHHKDNVTAIKDTLKWHANRIKSENLVVARDPRVQKSSVDAKEALSYIERMEGHLLEVQKGWANGAVSAAGGEDQRQGQQLEDETAGKHAFALLAHSHCWFIRFGSPY